MRLYWKPTSHSIALSRLLALPLKVSLSFLQSLCELASQLGCQTPFVRLLSPTSCKYPFYYVSVLNCFLASFFILSNSSLLAVHRSWLCLSIFSDRLSPYCLFIISFSPFEALLKFWFWFCWGEFYSSIKFGSTFSWYVLKLFFFYLAWLEVVVSQIP